MSARATIGIPCFNTERWLGAAIESALAQTWPDCEVIVVDDGSSDASVAVAEKFGDRVRVLRENHRGANHARNQVLAHSTGEWIQYLDADDYLEPDKIARQLAEANDGSDADVIYSPVIVETTTGTDKTRETTPINLQTDLFAQWIAWELPQTGGCLWRRSALAALGGWKEGQPCCQEHELYLRALKAGLRFVFAPTARAVYRIWSEETVCRKDPQQVITVKTGLIDNLYDWLSARNLWTQQHQHVAGRACFEMARSLAKFDIARAAAYHRDRMNRGLIHLAGPAAPASYKLVYHAAGFANAERLAAARR